jgi:hypothetical protein
MSVNEINDQETLEAWLYARPDEAGEADGFGITQRNACRFFPFFAQEMGASWASTLHLTALPILRVLLASGVLSKFRTRKVGLVVEIATHAAYATAYATEVASRSSDPTEVMNADDATNARAVTVAAAHAGASYNALNAACIAACAAADGGSASSLGSFPRGQAAAHTTSYAPVWAQIDSDARVIERGENILAAPLWSGPQPDGFRNADAKARTI